jgi:hypothetical protein
MKRGKIKRIVRKELNHLSSLEHGARFEIGFDSWPSGLGLIDRKLMPLSSVTIPLFFLASKFLSSPSTRA